MRTDSSPSLISISAMPDSSSNSMSFLTLRISMRCPLVLFLLAGQSGVRSCGRALGEIVTGGAQRQLISNRPQPSDGSNSDIGEVRVMPESFSRMNVTQVHLDERRAYAEERVPKRNAGMRERC